MAGIRSTRKEPEHLSEEHRVSKEQTEKPSKNDHDLDSVLAQIEKQHGAGAVMMLGSKKFVPVDVIPTSSLALDVALGIGGFPRGRVVELFGVESDSFR
jgi:recombination protein RecA